MSSDSTTEVLILSDEKGTYYAIPRSVLEQHKVTGEQKARIQEELGDDDVSGFAFRAANVTSANPSANADSYAADAYADASASGNIQSSSILSGALVFMDTSLLGNQLDRY